MLDNQTQLVPDAAPVTALGQQTKVYVVDTSVLLSDPHALRFFAEHEIVLPLVVINELEAKRHHPELGFAARTALRFLDDLRGQLPKIWSTLPDRLKQLLSYPLALPIGAREVVDIFVPESVDLSSFTELAITFRSIDTRLEILSRQ